MRMRRAWRAAIAVLAVACAPLAAHAQRVELAGRGDASTDDLIRRTLAEGSALVITVDTLIARGQIVEGRVLVAGATLRLEGEIRGDLFGVDANMFLRPGSRVTGNVTNIAGAYWPAENSTVEGEHIDLRAAPYDVLVAAGNARIIGMRRQHVLATDGLRGLRVPGYDRVDGLSISAGARLYLPPVGSFEPALHAHAGYATRRETGFGGIEAALFSERVDIILSADRLTATQDGWIRGPVHNGFGYLLFGEDHRNYYRADRGRAAVTYAVSDMLRTSLAFQMEEAVSLPAGDPWSLFEADSARANPTIDDSRITSALADVTVATESDRLITELTGRIELARNIAGGDHRFARYALNALFRMSALRVHTLSVQVHAQGPLPGTDGLPLQRWSILGGQETLETVDIGALRGDRVFLVRSTYRVPLEPLRIPALGSPALELVHAVGDAWTTGTSDGLRQTVGLRFRLPLLYAYAFLDPEDTDETAFGVGVSLRRRFPWEDPRP